MSPGLAATYQADGCLTDSQPPSQSVPFLPAGLYLLDLLLSEPNTSDPFSTSLPVARHLVIHVVLMCANKEMEGIYTPGLSHV